MPPAAFSTHRNPQRGPGRLTTRRRAQTWCSLFVAPCAPEGTPPVSTRLRPCWTDFLSILFGVLLLSQKIMPSKFCWAEMVLPILLIHDI